MKTQRERNAGGVVGWVIFGVLLCGIVFIVILPMFARTHCGSGSMTCQSNLKQIGLGYSMYEQDYGAWPVESRWVAELMPYTKNSQIFVCPQALKTDPGYAMNVAMNGKRSKDLPNPGGTLMAFDAKNGKLCFRHSEGCNNLFGDGHVKWFKESEARALLRGVAP